MPNRFACVSTTSFPTSSRMTSTQVNYLNIGLMVGSTVAAFVVPFEVFLFAYAVLGPLHYLTEISWLHDRQYFTKNKYDYLFLGLLCVLLFILSFVIKQQPNIEIGIIYIAFLSSLVMVLMKDIKLKLFSVGLIFVSIAFLKDIQPYQIFFSIFLPTIVHVFIFTGAFILLGALKGRSLSGIASLVVFVFCAASFFLHLPDASGYVVDSYVRESYATFQILNVAMIRFFGLSPVTSLEDVYSSHAGLVVMRLIAFAYMYHYLNWFSKTSIIKWNKISRKRTLGIGVLWLISLAIYGYDYRAGIMALFFLSFLHVFLEFPLDHQTFIGIGKELMVMARR